MERRHRRRTGGPSAVLRPDRLWVGAGSGSCFVITDLERCLSSAGGWLRDLLAVDGARQFWPRRICGGRLRERWHPTAPASIVEFRDGAHGVLAWAIAAVISGIIIAASVAGITSKAVEPSSSAVATAGEPLIAYELDRLFRAERHPPGAELTYARAEAARILLAAAGRQGISPDDRTYLVRLVAGQTGAAQADAERRADVAITAAATAVHKARRSAVIFGFSTAASLLFGAAAAWYAACEGGRHRDEVAPPLTWRW